MHAKRVATGWIYIDVVFSKKGITKRIDLCREAGDWIEEGNVDWKTQLVGASNMRSREEKS